MPKFSAISKKRLASCHPLLQELFNEIIKEFDCKILEGHRPQGTQNKYYKAGKSKLKWPKSRHNRTPSWAVDVAPYPIIWDDTGRFYFFGGYVVGVADKLGIKIRWGGDWSGDKDIRDQTFNDLVHFELL